MSEEKKEEQETKEDAVETGRVVSRIQNQPNLVSGVRFCRVSAPGEAPVHVSEEIADPEILKKFCRIRGYTPWDGEGGSAEEIDALIEEQRVETQTQSESDRETIESLITNNKTQGRELSRLRQENQDLREAAEAGADAQTKAALREAEDEVTTLKQRLKDTRVRVEAIASQANAKAIREALEGLAADLLGGEDAFEDEEEGDAAGKEGDGEE